MKIVRSDKIAIKFGDKNITYETLLNSISYYSSLTLDLPEASKILIYSDNCAEYIYAFLSIWQNRNIAMPLDTTINGDNLGKILLESSPKAIFCSKNYENILLGKLNSLGLSARVMVFEDLESSDFSSYSHPDEKFREFEENATETAMIVYKLGICEDPVGVMLTKSNIIHNIRTIVSRSRQINYIKGAIVLALPLYNPFSILISIGNLFFNNTQIILESLDFNTIVKILVKNRSSIVLATSSFYLELNKNLIESINKNRFANSIFNVAKTLNILRLFKPYLSKFSKKYETKNSVFYSIGSHLDKRVQKDLYCLSFNVVSVYSLIEAGGLVFFPLNGIERFGSVGNVDENEIEIVDKEVVVRGKNVMQGYYKNPEATQRALRDGWLFTGDFGVKNAKGDLYVFERKNNTILLKNGYRILPRKIETELLKLSPIIKEAAISLIDDKLVAIISVDPKKLNENNVQGVNKALKELITDKYNANALEYDRINDIFVLKESLPKDSLGRILREQLPQLVKNGYLSCNGKNNLINAEDCSKYREYLMIKDYILKNFAKEAFPEAHLELDLGLDSLERIGMQYFIKKNFAVDISTEELFTKQSLGELVKFIREQRSTLGSNKAKGKDWIETLKSDNGSFSLPKKSLLFRVLDKAIFFENILTLTFTSYFKSEIKGIENIDDGACLIISNHQSMIDWGFIYAALKEKWRKDSYCLAKDKLLKSRIALFFTKNFNVIEYDLEKNSDEALQKIAWMLRNGKKVMIFPEGTRSRTGDLNKFYPSFAVLAKETNVPIIPAVIKGADEVLPIGKIIPRRGTVKIEFLKPIFAANKSYDEIVKTSFEAIEKVYYDK